MVYRRRRSRSIPGPIDQTSTVEQLAFKYKEMCKVESSTDSDSEISPRGSDSNTMECVSSVPESDSVSPALPLRHGAAGRRGFYSMFLDPYDGSSEDSDDIVTNPGAASRRTRQHGKGDAAREQECHRLDVHMKCVDPSPVWTSKHSKELTGAQAADIEVCPRLHGDAMLESFLERSPVPCNLQTAFKRKMNAPVADGTSQRKRPCVAQMEEE
ncbi:uncharacterized protein LOC144089714 [Stigmatopora argus]